MKFLIQVVNNANVKIDNKITGQIQKGFLVFIGIGQNDNMEIADKMIDKMLKLRIFEDENGKTNLSLDSVGGSLLLVSQFTLYANCKRGNRPSFTDAGDASISKSLYEYIINKCKENVATVQTGEFGADMKVSLENNGPFTIMLDSDTLFN